MVDSSAVVPVSEFIRTLQLVKALSRGFQDRETHFGLVAYGTQTKKAFDLEVIIFNIEILIYSRAYRKKSYLNQTT